MNDGNGLAEGGMTVLGHEDATIRCPSNRGNSTEPLSGSATRASPSLGGP